MKNVKMNGAVIFKTILAGCFIVSLLAATPHSVAKQTDPNKLIMVCHNGQATLIKVSSWPMHRDHGDQIGSCESQPSNTGTEAYRKRK